MQTHLPQLSYLGVISHPESSEYGFQLINNDKTIRLFIMTIANSFFLTRQLMVQEAPDLCYQKILADLRSETPCLIDDVTLITDSDIAHYRSSHPNSLKQRHFKPAE